MARSAILSEAKSWKMNRPAAMTAIVMPWVPLANSAAMSTT
jgi:hypothetical protein